VAKLNPIRFSTQYADDVTEELKYLNREYAPSTGRWPNRDPIGEAGFEVLRNGRVDLLGDGPNLYCFVLNNAINLSDAFGLVGGAGRPDAGPGGKSVKCDCEKRGGKYMSRVDCEFGGNMIRCIDDCLGRKVYIICGGVGGKKTPAGLACFAAWALICGGFCGDPVCCINGASK
jgi:RHS repeat-associated protein